MRVLCEVSILKDGTEESEDPTYTKEQFYLLHFGLERHN